MIDTHDKQQEDRNKEYLDKKKELAEQEDFNNENPFNNIEKIKGGFPIRLVLAILVLAIIALIILL